MVIPETKVYPNNGQSSRSEQQDVKDRGYYNNFLQGQCFKRWRLTSVGVPKVLSQVP